MTRWLITGSLLLLAIVCMATGLAQGARILIALGVLFECAFWFRVLGRRQTPDTSDSSPPH